MNTTILTKLCARLTLLLALSLSAFATTDPYLTWCTGYFQTEQPPGNDPDRDGLPNLLEYLGNTDPTQYTVASEIYKITTLPAPPAPVLQLTAWQRMDDPISNSSVIPIPPCI